MQRPTWLDPCISFRGDTPDRNKQRPPVLLDIHSRTSQKVWKWGVEVDFIGCSAAASTGAWANIDEIAHCCCGKPWPSGPTYRGPAMRGTWYQFNFKTAKDAFRFAQQTLLFVRAMKQEDIGLLPQAQNDPLNALFMTAQTEFFRVERETRFGIKVGGPS